MLKRRTLVDGALVATMLSIWLFWPVPVMGADAMYVEIHFSNSTGPEATTTAVCDRTKQCTIPVPLLSAAAGTPIALNLQPRSVELGTELIPVTVRVEVVPYGADQNTVLASWLPLSVKPFMIILDASGAGDERTNIYDRTDGFSDAWRQMNKQTSNISDGVWRRPLPLTTMAVHVQRGQR